MKSIIKSISIQNFKGIKDKTINFNEEVTAILGHNGSGKTTIADAYYWLFTDKDTSLCSNPNIKPLGVEECTPTVSVIMDIDGKEIEFVKSQKIKKLNADENGISKISSNNTYMINSVPKTERDFKAYIEELKMPKDNDFLIMSHTDVFTNMKQADMRKLLFSMVENISDLDVAKKTKGINELKKLLETYTLDEIEAMQKASMKKVKEQLENIPGQIEGLELGKTEMADVAEQELLVSNCKKEIALANEKLLAIDEEKNRFSTLCSEGLKLEFDRNSELQRINDLANDGRKELESQLNHYHNLMVDLKRKLSVDNAEISQLEKRIELNNFEVESLKKSFEDAKALVFDETDTICPCCGQTYPEDKQKEIKKKFEADRQSKMDQVNHTAKDRISLINNLKDEIKNLEKVQKITQKELENCEGMALEISNKIENFKPTEIEPTPELKAIDEKIAAIEKEKEEIKKHNNDECKREICLRVSELQLQIEEASKIIGANSNNVWIDEQIENLNEKRIELEQAKADCEKILYEIELLSKEKNKTLTAEINKHFTRVKFQLFEYLKNGSYKDACTILSLDNKPFGIATNTALEMTMKIDICESFQKFYGVEMPLFIDGAEAFDTETYYSILQSCQHIYLAVTDDELKVNQIYK